MKVPFAVPANLPPGLARVEAYCEGLLRGSAKMPFADDLRLTDLPDLSDRLFLIDVFQRPQRFRFGLIGARIDPGDLAGRFLDETDLDAPFDYLLAQCCAATESARATCFEGAPTGGEPAYLRLVIPLWADGRIATLLGALEVR